MTPTAPPSARDWFRLRGDAAGITPPRAATAAHLRPARQARPDRPVTDYLTRLQLAAAEDDQPKRCWRCRRERVDRHSGNRSWSSARLQRASPSLDRRAARIRVQGCFDATTGRLSVCRLWSYALQLGQGDGRPETGRPDLPLHGLFVTWPGDGPGVSGARHGLRSAPDCAVSHGCVTLRRIPVDEAARSGRSCWRRCALKLVGFDSNRKSLPSPRLERVFR